MIFIVSNCHIHGLKIEIYDDNEDFINKIYEENSKLLTDVCSLHEYSKNYIENKYISIYKRKDYGKYGIVIKIKNEIHDLWFTLNLSFPVITGFKYNSILSGIDIFIKNNRIRMTFVFNHSKIYVETDESVHTSEILDSIATVLYLKIMGEMSKNLNVLDSVNLNELAYAFKRDEKSFSSFIDDNDNVIVETDSFKDYGIIFSYY